jgi:RNA polymerase sigma factor (sigma-70 family)
MRCQRGDAAAMEELVHLWERPLYYYLRRLIDGDEHAMAAMQEVWLKVLKGIGRMREPKSFAAWAYAITRATAMDHMRDEYARQAVQLDEEDDIADRGADETAAFDNAEQIHGAMKRLSLRHREVLTLFFLQDLSLAEIATMLDISEGTVKSQLHYAKKSLKKVLTESDKEHDNG